MKRTHKFKRGTPKPICKGCLVARVKDHSAKYCCVACIPRSVRAAACTKGRKNFAYRRRAATYRNDLDGLGRTPTREDILAVLQKVYVRAYNAGFQVGLRAAMTDDRFALARAQERNAA